MRRTVPLVALALVVAVAGCLALTPDNSPTDGATPTVESTQTDAMLSTESTTATDRGSSRNATVEYVIASGGVPDELGSVTVTMQAVFVESTDDFERNACWRGTYHGPYKPTPTPIGTPSGDCGSAQQLTLDLGELDGTRTLEVTVPARFDAGHGLVVTDVTATDRNGTSVPTIRGADGHRASIVRGHIDGQYSVEFAIDSVDDRPYDYWFVSETGDADR
jgi:hypothetical protein